MGKRKNKDLDTTLAIKQEILSEVKMEQESPNLANLTREETSYVGGTMVLRKLEAQIGRQKKARGLH
jgi:hypothetical protein